MLSVLAALGAVAAWRCLRQPDEAGRAGVLDRHATGAEVLHASPVEPAAKELVPEMGTRVPSEPRGSCTRSGPCTTRFWKA